MGKRRKGERNLCRVSHQIIPVVSDKSVKGSLESLFSSAYRVKVLLDFERAPTSFDYRHLLSFSFQAKFTSHFSRSSLVLHKMARFLPPPLDPSSIAPPSRTDNGTDYGSSEFTDSKSTANPSVRFARDISSTLKPSRDNTLASIVTDRTEDRSIPDESRLDSSLPDKSKGQTSDLTSVPPSSMPNTSRQQSSIPDSTVGQPGFDTFNSKADTQLSELPFSKTEITVDTMDSKPLKGIMKKPGNPRTNKSTRITWNPSTNRTSNKTGTTRRRRSRRGKDSRRTGGSSRRTGGSSRRTGGSSRQTETSSRQTRGSSRRARRSSCRIGGSRSSRRTTKSSRLSRDAGSTSRPTTDTPKIGKWKKPIDSTRYSPTDIRRVLGKSEAWLSTTNADDWTKDRLTKDISYLRDRFEEGDADGWSRRSSRRWKSGISNLSDKLSDISNTDGQGAEWTKIASSVFSR